MSVPSDDDILGFFEAHPAPLKPKALGRRLGLPKNDWGDLKQTLFRLVREGRLEYAGRGGSFGPLGGNEQEQQRRQKPDHRAERAKSHRRFPDQNHNPADESYIPPPPQSQPLRKPARGEPINMVGIVVTDKKTGELKVQPCDKRRHDQFFGLIAYGNEAGAKEGDIVVAEPAGSKQKFCQITKVLGRKDDPGMFSLISMHEQGLRTEFSAAAMGEANNAAKMAIPEISDKRRDERKTPFVTVDGADARDFDDAIWAEKTGKGWHIKVAIADVSWYVRPEDELNGEAYIRGNSTYFPDRVNPMLPKELSNGVCSLNPGVDRAVMVFEMWLDENGAVTKKADPYRALINSAARLTYEQLQKAHDGQPDATTAPLMDSVVTPLYGAYEALAKARAARGTLDLELPELKVKVKTGSVADIGPYERLTSHRVIEEFMLAANVAAAQALEEKLSPVVYRVHDAPPSEDKLRDLLEYAAGFGLDVPEKIEERDDLRDLLAKAKDQPFYSLIADLMLRSQAKAAYDTENVGHYGLALESYAHFTSPIRRYADLMVHRLLVTAFNMGAGGITPDEKATLKEISTHISETEVRSTFAERDSEKRYAAAYLADHIGETFSGQISSVNKLGLFVKLEKTGVQGFIPRKQLTKDFYEYEEEDHALIGRDTGRLYRSGAPIEVKLRAVNPLVGLIDLVPANDRSADIPGFTNKFHPGGGAGDGPRPAP